MDYIYSPTDVKIFLEQDEVVTQLPYITGFSHQDGAGTLVSYITSKPFKQLFDNSTVNNLWVLYSGKDETLYEVFRNVTFASGEVYGSVKTGLHESVTFYSDDFTDRAIVEDIAVLPVEIIEELTEPEPIEDIEAFFTEGALAEFDLCELDSDGDEVVFNFYPESWLTPESVSYVENDIDSDNYLDVIEAIMEKVADENTPNEFGTFWAIQSEADGYTGHSVPLRKDNYMDVIEEIMDYASIVIEVLATLDDLDWDKALVYPSDDFPIVETLGLEIF